MLPTPRSDRRPPLGIVLLLALGLSTACNRSSEGTRGTDSSDGDAPPAAQSSAGGPELVAESVEAPPFERVVLVTIDTLRADHVGSYGYRRDTTPFLDRLAAGGARFDQAISSVSHTGPSHASILTGMHPARHGLLRGEQLLDSVPSLAEALGTQGYDTAAFLSVSFLDAVARGVDHVSAGKHTAADIRQQAQAWLAAEQRAPRFFLWLHFYDPHRWMTQARPPEEDLAALRASGAPTLKERFEYLRQLHDLEVSAPGEPFRILLLNEGNVRMKDFSLEAYLAAIDRYDALTHWVDRELEVLHDTIETRFGEGATLWAVTADHGEGLGSHRVVGHGSSVFNEQLRVPLILYASDGSVRPAQGDSVDELVQLVDLMPTLAEALGLRAQGYDAALDGASLWPLLRSPLGTGEQAWRSRPAFSMRRPEYESPEESRGSDLFALQSERFKWIGDRQGQGQWFDLIEDPNERDGQAAAEGAEGQALRSQLEARVQRLEEGARGRPAQEIPEAWLEELKALGYVE